ERGSDEPSTLETPHFTTEWAEETGQHQQGNAGDPIADASKAPAASTAPAPRSAEPTTASAADRQRPAAAAMGLPGLSVPTAPAADQKPQPLPEPLARDFAVDLDEPLANQLEAEPETRFSEATPRSRTRRRFPLQAVAVVLGGAVGLALGYAGLVLVKGPSGDVLGLARRLPESMLPESFASNAPTVPPADSPESSAVERDPLVQPATFEEDPPQPNEGVPPAPLAGRDALAIPRDELRPAGAPSYSMADLRTALDGADAARAILSENNLAQDPDAAREMGGAFAKLCQLANVLTFVEDDAADRDLTLLEAKEVFHRLFQYQHARRDARDMASRWLAWPDRSHGGVVLAGKLISAQKQGSVYAYYLRLSGDQEIEVLTAEHIDPGRFTGASEMGVVGWIVDSPQQQVPGYAGNARQAIWVGHTISLLQAKFP
ncbi:MAG: hypothetical protein KDA37_15930, partial [Planctomycetales bacterium]|nr:hypothetical protein [Planctomycetales bacterium]